MFSGPKLLLLFAVLWLVWLVFRLIDRRNRTWNAGQDKTAEKRLTALLSLQNVKDVEPMSQRQGATILTAL
ncbi:MAG: hypothetical protein CM15mP100_2040 [Alphaproteobacteria bacterium]|nr:MAG: hypothetical protein CM15mP100_2040 [Alphaproteobacteria bacterium]